MNTFFNQALQTQKEHSKDNGTIAKKNNNNNASLGNTLSNT